MGEVGNIKIILKEIDGNYSKDIREIVTKIQFTLFMQNNKNTLVNGWSVCVRNGGGVKGETCGRGGKHKNYFKRN